MTGHEQGAVRQLQHAIDGLPPAHGRYVGLVGVTPRISIVRRGDDADAVDIACAAGPVLRSEVVEHALLVDEGPLEVVDEEGTVRELGDGGCVAAEVMGSGPDSYDGRLIPRLTVIGRADEQNAVEIRVDISACLVKHYDNVAVLELGGAYLAGVAGGVVIEGELLDILHYLTHFGVLCLPPCRLKCRAFEVASRFGNQPLMPT